MGERKTPLFGNQQALGERPLLIDPLRFAAETGIVRKLEDFFGGVLVAAFSPNRLISLKFHHKLRSSYGHRLATLGA